MFTKLRLVQFSKLQQKFYFFSPSEKYIYFWDEKKTQLGFKIEFNGFNAVQPKITHFDEKDFKQKDHKEWQKKVQHSKRKNEEHIRMGREVKTIRGVRKILEGSMNTNVDICLEIKDLGVLLMATCDCRLALIDAVSFRILMKVQLDIKRIQQILFSGSHQTIILINHSNNIPLFLLTLKDGDFEIEFVSNLIGHLSILVTATMIEERGFLVSVDESNVVKVWNLTLRRCVQTLELATKFPVSSVYFQNEFFRISFISKKINQFELTVINDGESDTIEDHLLDFHFDPLRKRIYIFKSSCSFTIDSENGRILQIKHYQTAKSDVEQTEQKKQIKENKYSIQVSPQLPDLSTTGDRKSPKDLKNRIKSINQQTLKEQQLRKKVKNQVRNFGSKSRLDSRKSLLSVPMTPRFAPKKQSYIDSETGLDDIYSWVNNASSLKVINHGHHLAKGTFSGKAQIESLTKDDSKCLSPHPSKVLAMHYDYEHHLCLSASATLFQIQKENMQGYTSIRKLRLKNFPQEPSLITLSVQMNMIVFISSLNQIFIVDYEFLRVFARVYVPCITIPTPRSRDKTINANVCKIEQR